MCMFAYNVETSALVYHESNRGIFTMYLDSNNDPAKNLVHLQQIPVM